MDEKKQEDLTFNFSKVKSWFKGSKVHSASSSPTEGVMSGSADVNKVSTHNTGKDVKSDEVSIDFKKVGKFLFNYRILLLLLIPFLIAGWLRVQGADLPMTQYWARDAVERVIRADISDSIGMKYPNLPQARRDALAGEELGTAFKAGSYTFKTGNYRGQQVVIKQQIDMISKQFKEYFQYEENGKQYPYMPDIDPYTYLRWTKNIISHGYPGDVVLDGKQWDNHMVAPIGNKVDDTWHPHILAWIYRVFSIFDSKIPIMQAVNYFPVIFAMLTVIPAFFLARKVGGNWAGFFAAMIIAISPTFLGRTTWGHADTDAYNIFFPLLIAWLFMEGFESLDRKKLMIWTGLAGLSTALFATVWVGYWYIFDFLLGVSAIYFCYQIYMYRQDILNNPKHLFSHHAISGTLLATITYIITTGIFVSLFVSFFTFWQAPLAPFDFMSIKAAASANLWPNVLTTVAELNEVNYSQVIGSVGGMTLFLIGVIGTLLSVIRKDQHGKLDIKFAFFLIIWFASTMYASTKGIRFVMLLTPAFAIGFGIAVGFAVKYLSEFGKKGLHLPEWVSKSVIILLFGILLMPTFNSAVETASRDIPIVNDAWVSTLTKIKEDSAPNAIITSWWDFGHHFKYFADRPVTFDGASQNEPTAHWVGKILLTDDEKLAAGILRMLDCGANNAFRELDKVLNDASISVKTLYVVVTLDVEGAKKVLANKGLNEGQADSVLKYTHCNAPEAYFIASQDMIGKSGVWAHFGSWNFDRADAWVVARGMPRDNGIEFIKKNAQISKEEATSWYDDVKSLASDQEANSWIAPWPSYRSSMMSCGMNNGILECEQGIKIDPDTLDVQIPSQEGYVHPVSIVYPLENATAVRNFKDAKFGASVILILKSDSARIVLADPAIANSMFTRMFFYEGQGLRYFKPFYTIRDVGNNFIYTYKVDWTGENVTNYLVPKTPEVTPVPDVTELNSTIDDSANDSMMNSSAIANETNATGE